MPQDMYGNELVVGDNIIVGSGALKGLRSEIWNFSGICGNPDNGWMAGICLKPFFAVNIDLECTKLVKMGTTEYDEILAEFLLRL